MYQSDITKFLNELKQQRPTLEEEQRRGRALLWDKQPIDLEERTGQQVSRVNQTPYVYYQNF
jgi:thiamine kinase-like enzyme